jgi:hypothetical protein
VRQGAIAHRSNLARRDDTHPSLRDLGDAALRGGAHQRSERGALRRQSLSSGQLASVYGFTDLDGSQPDAWRYLVEVHDAGKPADVTGYR